MNGVKTAWPPLLVITVISFVYTVFMVYNCIPQLERATSNKPASIDPNDPNSYTPSYGEILGILIGFHVLFFLMLFSFLRSSITSPGFIPKAEPWLSGTFTIAKDDEEQLIKLLENTSLTEAEIERERAFFQKFPVLERKLDQNNLSKDKTKVSEAKFNRRFCKKCQLFKPDRAHHCSICNKCILRMDHHCPWIANCVGFENYKFFLLFLLYGAACAGFACGAMLRRLIKCFRPVLDTSYFLRVDLLIIIAYLLAAFLFLALFIFFCFHMRLVFNCLTTIELREKQSSDKPTVKHQWLIGHQKYDRGGGYRNFVHIFGSPWMWLIPVKSDRANTDGTYAETTTNQHSD